MGGKCEEDSARGHWRILTVVTSIAFAPIISSSHYISLSAFKIYKKIFVRANKASYSLKRSQKYQLLIRLATFPRHPERVAFRAEHFTGFLLLLQNLQSFSIAHHLLPSLNLNSCLNSMLGKTEIS